MKEHGILFTSAMVRAILAGQKSQTRRAVKSPHVEDAAAWADLGGGRWESGMAGDYGRLAHCEVVKCPHGPVGRRLWVRETWHQCPHCERTVSYRAGGWREAPSGAPDDAGDRCDDDTRPLSPKCEAHGWKPSIHMPRWASRITLEVTRVRVERVGDISGEDVAAEGTPGMVCGRYQCARCNGSGRNVTWPDGCPGCNGTGVDAGAHYRHLWDSINGAGSFAASPWVWVYDFRRVG